MKVIFIISQEEIENLKQGNNVHVTLRPDNSKSRTTCQFYQTNMEGIQLMELVIKERTHAICSICWNLINPKIEPFRMIHAPVEKCCFCGQPTSMGIYVRNHSEKAKYCDHG